LVYLDDGEQAVKSKKDVKFDGRYLDSKLLWAFGNYARFIRPGMVRVKCNALPQQSVKDGVLVSAYKGMDDSLLVVLVNLSAEKKICNLGFSKNANVYTTSENSNLKKSQQNTASIQILSRAVATVLVNN
jgi:hypothetical protein